MPRSKEPRTARPPSLRQQTTGSPCSPSGSPSDRVTLTIPMSHSGPSALQGQSARAPLHVRNVTARYRSSILLNGRRGHSSCDRRRHRRDSDTLRTPSAVQADLHQRAGDGGGRKSPGMTGENRNFSRGTDFQPFDHLRRSCFTGADRSLKSDPTNPRGERPSHGLPVLPFRESFRSQARSRDARSGAGVKSSAFHERGATIPGRRHGHSPRNVGWKRRGGPSGPSPPKQATESLPR